MATLAALPSVSTDIMDITHTHAPLMGITVPTGLLVECSSGLAPGFTVPDGWDNGAGQMGGTVVRGTVIPVGAVIGTAARVGAIAVATNADISGAVIAEDFTVVKGSTVLMDSTVVGITAEAASTAAVVDSTAAEAVSTAVEGSTVEAVGPMEVVTAKAS
jgi:hypothetical protein